MSDYIPSEAEKELCTLLKAFIKDRDTFVGTILMLRVNQSDPDENCRKLIDFLKDNPTADCDIILEKVDEIIQHE